MLTAGVGVKELVLQVVPEKIAQSFTVHKFWTIHYLVRQKAPFYILNNCVKPHPMFIIFGIQIPE